MVPDPAVATGAPVVLGTGKRVVVALTLAVAFDLLSSLADTAGGVVFPTWHDAEADPGGPGESLLLLGAVLVGILAVVLQIVLIVLFCIWIHRANRNARALGSQLLDFTPGWCVGWWFVPLANLFKPYQAVKEVYRASSPDHDATGWRLAAAPSVFGYWWTAWLASNIAANFGLRMSFSDDPATLRAASYLDLLSAVIAIAAALLLRSIITGIESRQAAKALVVGAPAA